MIAANLKSFGDALRMRWETVRHRDDVQRAMRWLRYVFFAAVVAYLVFKLSRIGWLDVVKHLPVSPWFYVFFLLRFLALPITELAIFETLWSTPLIRHFSVFIRKRVYNFAVIGYSGEGFLTLWARRRLPLTDATILHAVKDNAILSAFASNLATVFLILFLAAGGWLRPALDAFPGAGVLFVAAFLIAGSLAVAVALFGRKLIAMPKRQAPFVLSVQGMRHAILILLHPAMYAAALPGAPIEAWLVFTALQLAMSRIPFIPNQDIVYLTAALSLAPLIGAPDAAIAGVLVAEAGLAQGLAAALFALTAPLARDSSKPR